MKKFWPIVLVLFAACGRNNAGELPSPRIVEAEMKCPESMWKAGDLRPASIEVINQSQDSVIVFLDRCRGHTRVGEVAAGETRLLEMPDGALSFRGMLRFYTYRGPDRQVAVEVASPDGDPHLRLVLPEAAMSDCPQVVVDGRRVASYVSIPKDSIETMRYEPAPVDDLRSCGRIIVTTRR